MSAGDHYARDPPKLDMRVFAFLFAWLITAPTAFAATQATLYRSPDCGCCLDYSPQTISPISKRVMASRQTCKPATPL